MALQRRCYAKLKLRINESKSAVARVAGRKFLGHGFWFGQGGVKCKVAAKALATFKQRVRQLSRRSGGRGMAKVVERLRGLPAGMESLLRAVANAGHLAVAG